MKTKSLLPTTLSILTLLAITFYFAHKSNFTQPNSSLVTPAPTIQLSATQSATSGYQAKTSGCVVQGHYPDKSCTPGAVFPNVTKNQICVSGYSSTVRNVPQEEKTQVYQEYGITSHKPGDYEVDHLISLELGGSNDISNLWPEAANPKPGFHEKDLVENYLHAQVCNGSMSLQEAQQKIANDWLSIYNAVPDIKSYKY